MKTERCLSSLVYSHSSRILNIPNNEKNLQLMKYSNYKEMNDIFNMLTSYKSKAYSDIEHLRNSFNTVEKADSKTWSWASLIAQICKAVDAKRILEIGTSVGVSSAYMARENPNTRIDTIEIEKSIYEKAIDNNRQLGIYTIDYYNADYQSVLPHLLFRKEKKYDVIFKDAYHVGVANINLLCQLIGSGWTGIIILDDVRWSWDMYEAWKRIKLMDNVASTIDFYHVGVILLGDKRIKDKEHYYYSLPGIIP